jgi:hypothetical protein
MTEIIVTPHNINDYFSNVELVLNSYFNDALVVKPMTIVLENDTYRITYTKQGVSYRMTIKVLSPTLDSKRYNLTTNATVEQMGGKPLTPQLFNILQR